jgi:hypothetical protein
MLSQNFLCTNSEASRWPRLRALIPLICESDVTLNSSANTLASKPRPISARWPGGSLRTVSRSCHEEAGAAVWTIRRATTPATSRVCRARSFGRGRRTHPCRRPSTPPRATSPPGSSSSSPRHFHRPPFRTGQTRWGSSHGGGRGPRRSPVPRDGSAHQRREGGLAVCALSSASGGCPWWRAWGRGDKASVMTRPLVEILIRDLNKRVPGKINRSSTPRPTPSPGE